MLATALEVHIQPSKTLLGKISGKVFLDFLFMNKYPGSFEQIINIGLNTHPYRSSYTFLIFDHDYGHD